MGDGTPCGMNTMMNETPLRPGRAHIAQSHHCAGTGRGVGGGRGVGARRQQRGSPVCHCDALFLCVLRLPRSLWSPERSTGKVRQTQL